MRKVDLYTMHEQNITVYADWEIRKSSECPDNTINKEINKYMINRLYG